VIVVTLHKSAPLGGVHRSVLTCSSGPPSARSAPPTQSIRAAIHADGIAVDPTRGLSRRERHNRADIIGWPIRLSASCRERRTFPPPPPPPPRRGRGRGSDMSVSITPGATS